MELNRQMFIMAIWDKIVWICYLKKKKKGISKLVFLNIVVCMEMTS